MALNPVDRDSKYMQEQFGTRVLITDLAADKYLSEYREDKQKKYTEFCGGAGGWDDYCEHWT